jgi:tRNA 2-selenouridine synthase SelU
VTNAQFNQVILRISKGETLRAVARDLEFDPSIIYQMKAIDPEKAQRYAQARESQAECMVDELLEVADTQCNSQEEIQQLKIRVDLKKWVTARNHPARFGDKIQTEVSGKDGGPIQTTQIVVHRGKDPRSDKAQ